MHVEASLRPTYGAPKRLVEPLLFAAVALLALYVVGVEQGQLLNVVGAHVAAKQNWLHEFFHDGRHLLGFPCH